MPPWGGRGEGGSPIKVKHSFKKPEHKSILVKNNNNKKYTLEYKIKCLLTCEKKNI